MTDLVSKNSGVRSSDFTEMSSSTRRSQRQVDLPTMESSSKLRTKDVSVLLDETETTKSVRTVTTTVKDTPRTRLKSSTTIEEGSMGFHQMMALPKSFLLYSHYIKSTNPKEISENQLIPILLTNSEYKGDNLNELSSDSENVEEIKPMKADVIYDDTNPEQYTGPLDKEIDANKEKKPIVEDKLTSTVLTIGTPKYVTKEVFLPSKKSKQSKWPDTINVTDNVLTFTILNNARPGDDGKSEELIAKEKSRLFSQKLQKQKIYEFGDLDLVTGSETGPDPIDPLVADPTTTDTTTLLKSKLLRTTVARSPSIGTPGRTKAKDLVNIKILKPKSEKLKSQILVLEQGVVFTEFEHLEIEPINELVDTEFFQDKVKEEFDVICPVIDSYNSEPYNVYLTRFKPIQIPEIKLSIITEQLLLNPIYRYSSYLEILDRKVYIPFKDIIDESIPVIDNLKANIRRGAYFTDYKDFNHLRLNTHDSCIYYPVDPLVKKVHLETTPFIFKPVQKQRPYIEYFFDLEDVDIIDVGDSGDTITIKDNSSVRTGGKNSRSSSPATSKLTSSPATSKLTSSTYNTSSTTTTNNNVTTTTNVTHQSTTTTLKMPGAGTPTHLRTTTYSSTPSSYSTKTITQSTTRNSGTYTPTSYTSKTITTTGSNLTSSRTTGSGSGSGSGNLGRSGSGRYNK